MSKEGPARGSFVSAVPSGATPLTTRTKSPESRNTLNAPSYPFKPSLTTRSRRSKASIMLRGLPANGSLFFLGTIWQIRVICGLLWLLFSMPQPWAVQNRRRCSGPSRRTRGRKRGSKRRRSTEAPGARRSSLLSPLSSLLSPISSLLFSRSVPR